MSKAAQAYIAAIASEADRIRASMVGLRDSAVPALLADYDTQGKPNETGIVDAVNLCENPQFGTSSGWSASAGTLAGGDTDLPPRWSRCGIVTADASGTVRIDAAATASVTATHYWYALVKSTYTGSSPISVALRATAGGTILSEVQLAAGTRGWVLAGGSYALTAGSTYYVEAAGPSPVAGNQLFLTGITLCAADPGEAFCGDFATDPRHHYSWRGARNGSASVRRSSYWGAVEARERAADVNISPAGLTPAQRAQYLLIRNQARRKPWGSTFRDLVAFLIQEDDESFTINGIRIVEDFPAYAFRVEIAYSAAGLLADRVAKLIDDIAPAHLQLTEIRWGAFLASPNQAQTTLTGAQNLDGPGATATVAATAGFTAGPAYFEVNGTQYSYTAIGSGTTFTGVQKLSGAPTGWTAASWTNGAGGSQGNGSIVRQIDYAYGQAGEPL